MVLFNPVVDVAGLKRLAERFPKDPLAISPLQHVCPNLPPTIIFHGTDDTTVPFEQAQRFTKAMHKAGTPVNSARTKAKDTAFSTMAAAMARTTTNRRANGRLSRATRIFSSQVASWTADGRV